MALPGDDGRHDGLGALGLDAAGRLDQPGRDDVLGAVVEFMHPTVPVLGPAAPGYAVVRFAPRPGGDLTWATAALETRHGRVAIHWEQTPDGLKVETTLPDGVTGVLSLPDGREVEVGPGVCRFPRVPGET